MASCLLVVRLSYLFSACFVMLGQLRSSRTCCCIASAQIRLASLRSPQCVGAWLWEHICAELAAGEPVWSRMHAHCEALFCGRSPLSLALAADINRDRKALAIASLSFPVRLHCRVAPLVGFDLCRRFSALGVTRDARKSPLRDQTLCRTHSTSNVDTVSAWVSLALARDVTKLRSQVLGRV